MNIWFVDTAGLVPDFEGTVQIQSGFEDTAAGLEVEHSEIVVGKVGFGRLLLLFLAIPFCTSKEPVQLTNTILIREKRNQMNQMLINFKLFVL